MPIRKLLTTLLLAALLLLSLGLWAAAQQPPKGPDPTPAAPTPPPGPSIQIDRRLLPKIEPQLLKQLGQAPDRPVPFIVYLKAKTNLTAALDSAELSAQGELTPTARRQTVVQALRQTAQQSQAGVIQFLTTPGGGLTAQNEPPASQVKSLWITNAVAASGPLETVLAVAARPDVAIVRLDKRVPLSDPAAGLHRASRVLTPLQQTPEWGIRKIRADLVHSALQIDGAGVVVANIDTGVDWLHPDLQPRYRGYTGPGKLPNHTGNWYDAVGQGATYPVDTDGHGTHTMGTMVGQNGIGVAPGAQWIAIRAFDSSGTALNSWLHDAFQWAMAPNGNPALAPDIINNSWSSNNGFSTEFKADIQALLAAGIIPVFAAGNNGPGSGTVGSPGSLPEALAVGATDANDIIAGFSGRGPSPWSETKPEVSAPGVNVRSTLPGGTYGNYSGTSMAAPHVAGLAALLLQADPALAGDAAAVENVLKTTAVPLGSPIPNNNYGWGRVDAYSAVMAVGGGGTLAGVITDAVTGLPVGDALVQITPSLGGTTINAGSDAAGAYRQGLAPNTYDVTASAFGYQPATVLYVTVTTGTETVQNFGLSPKPTGVLSGSLTDKLSGRPLSATVSIENTPVGVTAFGHYQLELPIGVYTATVVAAEYRISSVVNISILPGITTTQNFALDSAPSILLVDSGGWYQGSQLEFFEQALADARYTHDTWQILEPFELPNDIPSAATLSQYDLVIWSAPQDSPGYIEADDELKAYLDGGGRLLLTGQDIAYFDGGGFFFSANYLKDYLMTRYVQDTAGTDEVSGVSGQPFAGLSFTISGGDGADNQISPDVIAVDNPDFAGPLLNYVGDDDLAGLHVGLCRPYRAIFLSFGLESINSRAHRRQAIEQSIDWLMQTPAAVGVDAAPAEETLIGNFGGTVSHTIRVRNTGSVTDTLNLNLTPVGPYNWPTGSLPGAPVLGPCQSQVLTVPVQLPASGGWHISDTFTVSVQSVLSPAFTDVVTRHTKTPAPVLLVDDDRWYSFAEEFESALRANNIPFDYWYVPKSFSGSVPPSPPLETLEMYPMVVWYTAYDWYQPLTPTEEERLMNYLDGGGRLFFSGQDFLYRHLQYFGTYGPFAQNYLGIESHTEDFTSTLAVGNNYNPASAYLGPFPFSFPAGYRNWTDALTPTSQAQVFTYGDRNRPNGLTNAGVGAGGQPWHTNFLAYGPELMSLDDRARLMQRSLGWLSWLGGSTIQAEAGQLANGATITYTATLSNNGWANMATAAFTATFPGNLTPLAAAPEMGFDGSRFTWSGPLAAGAQKILTYTARISQPVLPGQVISQTSWLAYADHSIRFDRITSLEATPNLSGSWMSVSPAQDIEENDVLTYTIMLQNHGFAGSERVTTTNVLPGALNLLAIDSAPGSVISSGNSITWTTALSRGAAITLTYRVVVSSTPGFGVLNVAHVADGQNPPLTLSAEARFKSLPLYLPVIRKNK